MIIGRIRRASVLLALQLLLAGCAGLPPRPAEPPTLAIAPGNETTLQRVAVASTKDFLESGFQLLPVATASLEARLALAARAEKTLDLQYFEWSNDPTGRYLLKTLRLAAERGVRVRVLVDAVVDDFPDQMMQARAVVHIADVHAGTFSHRFQTLEDLDGTLSVLRRHAGSSNPS